MLAQNTNAESFDKNQFLKSDLIGIVLCGGESTRMKTDKALLEYHNKPQWKRVLEILQSFCQEIVISINKNQWENWAKNENFNFIIDDEKYQHHGPISGILSVVEEFPNHSFFIIGTDFPLLKTENIVLLFQERSKNHDAICFEKNGFLQPLISILEKDSIPKLKDFFSQENDSFRMFLEEIKTKKITAEGDFLLNINTEEDFLNLKKLKHD